MKVEHDVAHDAAYFAFSAGVAVRQEKLGTDRIVDVAADGSIVGVEFLSPSRGLEMTGVPRAAEIARAARRRGMRVLPTSDVAHAG